LSQDAFRDMSKIYPRISPLRELRHALSELRLNDLTVGSDGRNRCLLSPFGARSGRNCPSNSRFIYGPAVWLRFLIQPPPGYGLAYIDWVQQEFAIAAALSGDANMVAAYQSGDAYLEFAKQAGAIPANATREGYESVRELYKQNALGVNYGMGAETLAARIGQPTIVARHLLAQHREIYQGFWGWSERCVDHAMQNGWQITVFGWVVQVFPKPNLCSLRNFHMQANGAEMLRIACCLGTENGIRICAPIHDAVLIIAPIDQLEADIAAMCRGAPVTRNSRSLAARTRGEDFMGYAVPLVMRIIGQEKLVRIRSRCPEPRY
jgi:DNA polymerase I